MVPMLSDEEKRIYEWQMWMPGFGQAGQERLKAATVMISRVGGLGSVVAYELAAAGVGRLVLAHGGEVKLSDLNRQLLMTYDWVGKPRIESIQRRLKQLNPYLDIVAVGQNVSADNAERLVGQADVVVDAAPLFEERYAMNQAAVRLGKPLVECAMYGLSASLFTVLPGRSACLRCVVPRQPAYWKRQFPVFGAVSGTVGCMAAMEVIKLLSGLGSVLADRMVVCDLGAMRFQTVKLARRADCPVCGRR